MITSFTFALSIIILVINNSQKFVGDTGLAVVCIALISIAFVFDIISSGEIIWPILIGYFWRLALLFFDLFGRDIYCLPGSGADSEAFYDTSVDFCNGIEVTYGLPFTKVMGSIFHYIGPSRVFGQYILLMFSIVSIIFFAKALKELCVDIDVRNRALYIMALIPNYSILSSIFLRESIISMFCTISLFCFARWINHKNELFYFLSIVFSLIAAMFHSGVAGLSFGFVIMRILYKNKVEKIGFSLANIFFASILLIAFAYIYINYNDVFFERISVTSVDEISDGSGLGDSTYAQYVGNSSSIINMIIYTPIRIVYYLFSPFPWQWRGLSDVIAFCFSSMFYIISIINAIRFINNNKIIKSKSIVMVLLIIIFCVTFVFAWGVSNTGTAIRHRDKIFTWILMIYAMSYDDRKGIRIKWGEHRIM